LIVCPRAPLLVASRKLPRLALALAMSDRHRRDDKLRGWHGFLLSATFNRTDAEPQGVCRGTSRMEMRQFVEHGRFGLEPMIKQRRSIRRYLAAPVSPDVIDRLLAAATCAPSAHNRQPWRFAIIEERPWKERLATAMGQRLRQDRGADGDDPQAIQRDADRSYARITAAPLIVLVCLDTSDMDHYPDERRRGAEYLMAVQSTAMAVQNLLLAAQGEGLGACIMCAPLFCRDTVADALGLPTGWEPQTMVTLGAAADPGKERPRFPLDKIVWKPPSPDGL